MPDAIDPRPPEVVQARRFELVGEDGSLMAVLGRLDTPDPASPIFGLALLDPSGRPRVWLALDANGPSQVFDLLGNNVLSIGVNDPTADALHIGAYMHFSDRDGMPVLGWQVEEDGSVLARLGGQSR